MAIHRKHVHGWNKDKHDERDHKFALKAEVTTSSDLRPGMPPVWDQGDIGSCTGHGIAACKMYLDLKKNAEAVTPSRLFIYYNERALERTIRTDAGAEIRDGIKVLAKKGAPDEKLWAYDTTKWAKKPNKVAFADALNRQILKYERVDWTNMDQVRTALSAGYPIVFGFNVYDAFESTTVAKTGVLNMPSKKEKQVGGHCVLLVGHDDASQRVIVRNSWGTSWGMNGYFTMPYEYITSPTLSDDFWIIKTDEE